MKLRWPLLLALCCWDCFAIPFSYVALAQTVTNQTEGIGGYIDSKRRNPVLTVSVAQGTSAQQYKILADATVPNEEFHDYPIQFEFFINRRLVSTQMMSKELPGPVGLDVGADLTTTPFNYTVVATVLYPNRSFTSVLHGAVFANNLLATLDCSLTVVTAAVGAAPEQSALFVANDVDTNQLADSALALQFEAAKEDGSARATVSGTLTVSKSEGTASGSLTITRDGVPQAASVSGEVEFSSDTLSSISVHSADDSINLSCLK